MKPSLNFEYTARKERKSPVYYGTDNPSWGRKTWRQLWLTIGGCLLFAIAAVIMLVVLGALAFLGVKKLD